MERKMKEEKGRKKKRERENREKTKQFSLSKENKPNLQNDIKTKIHPSCIRTNSIIGPEAFRNLIIEPTDSFST